MLKRTVIVYFTPEVLEPYEVELEVCCDYPEIRMTEGDEAYHHIRCDNCGSDAEAWDPDDAIDRWNEQARARGQV